jgi:hypothetical protein
MFSGGGDVRIVLDADAEPLPSVQWFRNELPVADVHGLELRFNPFLEDHAGTYSAVISNRLGVVNMPPFKILWNGQRMQPVIAIQSSVTSQHRLPIETSVNVRGPWSPAANELTSSDPKWRLFEAGSSESQLFREAGVPSRIRLRQGVAIEAVGAREGLHRVDYVEESSQWEEWKPLVELRLGKAPVWILDDQNTNQVKRFYRVVLLE